MKNESPHPSADGGTLVDRPVGRPAPERARLTPLKRRIVDMLAMRPRCRMSYYDMGPALWPAHLYPRAARCSSNGGPPGWAMPLGRALRELSEIGLVHAEQKGRLHGDVVLLKTPNSSLREL